MKPQTTNVLQQILVMDVGNTRLKMALFPKSNLHRSPALLPDCLASWTILRQQPIDWDTISIRIQETDFFLEQIFLAGSNQQWLEQLQTEWPQDWPPPRLVNTVRDFPLDCQVEAPERLGVDRGLNGWAACQLRKPFQPAIIVDAGTAITIDLVDTAGIFQGGAILPGFELEAHALHDYTSLLPLIPMHEIIGQNPSVIGKNTLGALRSGLIWGQLGAVKEIVARLEAVLASADSMPPLYLLTGGASPLLKPYLQQPFQEYPFLTLQALATLPE